MPDSFTIHIPEEVFVLIIFAIVALVLVVRKKLKNAKAVRTAQYTDRTSRPKDGRDQLAMKIRGLEQRLAMAEQLAIDPAHRLAAEIDQLGRIECSRERTEA